MIERIFSFKEQTKFISFLLSCIYIFVVFHHHAAPADLVMSVAEVFFVEPNKVPSVFDVEADVTYPLSTMKWLSSNQPNLWGQRVRKTCSPRKVKFDVFSSDWSDSACASSKSIVRLTRYRTPDAFCAQSKILSIVGVGTPASSAMPLNTTSPKGTSSVKYL